MHLQQYFCTFIGILSLEAGVEVGSNFHEVFTFGISCIFLIEVYNDPCGLFAASHLPLALAALARTGRGSATREKLGQFFLLSTKHCIPKLGKIIYNSNYNKF